MTERDANGQVTAWKVGPFRVEMRVSISSLIAAISFVVASVVAGVQWQQQIVRNRDAINAIQTQTESQQIKEDLILNRLNDSVTRLDKTNAAIRQVLRDRGMPVEDN